MKKNALFLFALSIFVIGHSQTTCPASIKSNSTPDEPTFVLSNGQNGCNEVTWPATILVDNLTYTYVSCSGGNLKYIMNSGQTAPTGFDVTVDYGNGLICDYDVNGDLTTLSNEDIALEDSQFIVYPNPAKIGEEVSVKFPKQGDYRVSIVNILGKSVFENEYNNKDNAQINVSKLSVGLYILKVFNNEMNVLKKVVIEN